MDRQPISHKTVLPNLDLLKGTTWLVRSDRFLNSRHSKYECNRWNYQLRYLIPFGYGVASTRKAYMHVWH